jgi:carboxy-terminal domain RNA polymerase II polypeptide A small phosphatase
MLLVLDLDETLIHATEAPLQHRVADFRVEQYHVYKRPYLADFLQQVSQHFDLAVWSSATDDYVMAICREIMADYPRKFTWGRSKCTPKHQFMQDFYTQEIGQIEFTKPFKKIKKLGFDLSQVLMVDDTPFKVANAYGNAVYIRPFYGEETDEELRHLAPYLISLSTLENVRIIEKRGWRNNVG